MLNVCNLTQKPAPTHDCLAFVYLFNKPMFHCCFVTCVPHSGQLRTIFVLNPVTCCPCETKDYRKGTVCVKLWLVFCVLCVRLRNVCFTCTNVSSDTSHCFPPAHVFCEEDYEFLVSLLVHQHVSCPHPGQGKYFYQALYFVKVYFLPFYQSWRGH